MCPGPRDYLWQWPSEIKRPGGPHRLQNRPAHRRPVLLFTPGMQHEIYPSGIWSMFHCLKGFTCTCLWSNIFSTFYGWSILALCPYPPFSAVLDVLHHQHLPRAGDAIHPVLWKREGLDSRIRSIYAYADLKNLMDSADPAHDGVNFCSLLSLFWHQCKSWVTSNCQETSQSSPQHMRFTWRCRWAIAGVPAVKGQDGKGGNTKELHEEARPVQCLCWEKPIGVNHK